MSGIEQRMDVTISEDRSSAKITFCPGGGVTGDMQVDADELLRLIQVFGKIRAIMIAGRELPSLEGQELEAVFNTRWCVQSEMVGEGSALTFYHPSFGPLGFLMPMDQAEKIARILNLQVERARTSKAERHH
jgi:hypothetical protein